ncbi:class I SAM-dependent methyltransferase [Larkinella humicola]|uniref:Class I SAM-dependent methyltransferase n=1 Tax=Larkinella humicola TaxID=2607654 RepID=A0A5N1JCG6_9BACT|nr:class I SAM-dependent methyltransferase [Larkinella humicola]KAA9347770.1 class I SAM-dependent methyltransferase [Larkinella humicola]
MAIIDNFSGHADLYAQYRIDYPPELYDFLLSITGNRQKAWDCATGNGQVASALSAHFDTVDATDISAQQLEKAVQKPNITYTVCAAEQTPFADRSFDIITVAQALHWFDTDAFHREVRRVAKPGAVLAEWGYGSVQIDPVIDPVFYHFYEVIIGPYWDENRKHVDDRYARISFPFDEVVHQDFTIWRSWDLNRFLNYLRTWSSVQKYIRQHGNDPVLWMADQLKTVWGAGERQIRFPVFLRAGRL